MNLFAGKCRWRRKPAQPIAHIVLDSIWTLAELAELSPFRFSRALKNATGMTPRQFVTRERMLVARQLTREIFRSLIAPEVDFDESEPSCPGAAADGVCLPGNSATLSRNIRRSIFPQEYDTGRTIPRAATRSLADGLVELQLVKLTRKQFKNYMTTKVCFTNGSACGIAAPIAEAPLVHGNQVAARKPEPVMPRSSESFLPVALDVPREDEGDVAVLLPRIAVAFTVGGPLVYQRRSNQLT